MKKCVLLFVFVCAIAEPVSGIPQIEQIINQMVSHPFIDFASNNRIGNPATIQSELLQSDETQRHESVEYQGEMGKILDEIVKYVTISMMESGLKLNTETHWMWSKTVFTSCVCMHQDFSRGDLLHF